MSLEEQLEKSVSQYVTTCEGSRFGIMLSYHQLKRLEKNLTDPDVHKQIREALRIAEGDHRYHVKRGTCVEQEPPRTETNKAWKR